MPADKIPGEHEGHPDGPRPVDHPARVARPAETRGRAEYYQAMRAAATDLSDRPRPDSLRLQPERASHILDGDRWGGGHRHQTGRPGKTEFPADWDDERIIGHIMDVARTPDVLPVMQPNHRWRLRGERDGVVITVIVHPDGRIWSAWPEEGSPGVVRNPREGQR